MGHATWKEIQRTAGPQTRRPPEEPPVCEGVTGPALRGCCQAGRSVWEERVAGPRLVATSPCLFRAGTRKEGPWSGHSPAHTGPRQGSPGRPRNTKRATVEFSGVVRAQLTLNQKTNLVSLPGVCSRRWPHLIRATCGPHVFLVPLITLKKRHELCLCFLISTALLINPKPNCLGLVVCN